MAKMEVHFFKWLKGSVSFLWLKGNFPIFISWENLNLMILSVSYYIVMNHPNAWHRSRRCDPAMCPPLPLSVASPPPSTLIAHHRGGTPTALLVRRRPPDLLLTSMMAIIAPSTTSPLTWHRHHRHPMTQWYPVVTCIVPPTPLPCSYTVRAHGWGGPVPTKIYCIVI
jgi:hypothetical protein